MTSWPIYKRLFSLLMNYSWEIASWNLTLCLCCKRKSDVYSRMIACSTQQRICLMKYREQFVFRHLCTNHLHTLAKDTGWMVISFESTLFSLRKQTLCLLLNVRTEYSPILNLKLNTDKWTLIHLFSVLFFIHGLSKVSNVHWCLICMYMRTGLKY